MNAQLSLMLRWGIAAYLENQSTQDCNASLT